MLWQGHPACENSAVTMNKSLFLWMAQAGITRANKAKMTYELKTGCITHTVSSKLPALL